MSPNSGRQIRRLVGVYDADATLRGELAYWIGSRLGRAHCALCDITHGMARERDDWRKCRDGLPVPFDTYHRDDQPDAIRAATGDTAPAVLAETLDGFVFLLSAVDLDACSGEPQRLLAAIEHGATLHHLDW